MKPLFRDDQGVIEFTDGIEPEAAALKSGMLTYRVIGVNPKTGNRMAEVLVTPAGMAQLTAQMRRRMS